MSFQRFKLCVLLIVTVFLTLITAEKCSVENISSSDFSTEYKNAFLLLDTYRGTIAEFPVGGITAVSIEKEAYLNVKIENDKIIIDTSDAFDNFEKDNEPVLHGRNIYFNSMITFECENGTSTLKFEQTVEDTNNNAPFFNKELYDFKFGMGLRQGFLLTEEVAASDYDLTKSAPLKFEISGDKLKIVLDDSVDSRSYAARARVTLLKDIPLPFDEIFTITVTDNGKEPFLTGTAKLRLTLQDASHVIPSPMFSKPVFHWTYKRSQNIIAETEEVTLGRGFGNGLVVTHVNPVLKEYFEVKLQDPSKSYVQVILVKAIPANLFEGRYFYLELEAKFPGASQSAKTVVQIKYV